MEFLLFIFITLTSFSIMILSIFQLCKIKGTDCPVFSWQHFFILVQVYFIVIIGFSMIHLGLYYMDKASLHFEGHISSNQHINLIGNMIYFSAMTVFTVGFGDIVPVGWSKVFVVIQSFIGYLLPAAFLVSGFNSANGKDIR